MSTTLDEATRRALDLITVTDDGREHVIGRPDLGIYVAVPEPGAVLVLTLQTGVSIAEAAGRASASAGEQVDGAAFLADLAEVGLFDEPAKDPAGQPKNSASSIRWIEGVSPRTAGLLFGPAAWTGYALAALFSLSVLVVRPDLRPSFESVWFLRDPALSLLAVFLMGVLLSAGHEAWHWLAGRAIGVPAIFRVSRRGMVLVFETDITQIVALPRRRRYGVFMAGMAFDVVVLAVALVLRLAYRHGIVDWPAVVDRCLAVVVLNQALGVLWQWAAVFLRSDGYAVLANALRCHNLYRATWLTAKRRLVSLPEAETAELSAISRHDRRVARWFALPYVAGILVMIWMFLSFGVPFMAGMLVWVWSDLANADLASIGFWESAAVLLLIVVQNLGPLLLALRERRLNAKGQLL